MTTVLTDSLGSYLSTSRFGLACAPVRCAHPSFWAHGHAWRCAPRAHRSFAAYSLFSKNENNLPNSGCPREGLFSSTLPPRLESIQSARPSIQSSELGPPPPQPQESVAPPLWIQGRRHTHFRMRRWGEPIPTVGHTLWYSKYAITIIPRRPRL